MHALELGLHRGQLGAPLLGAPDQCRQFRLTAAVIEGHLRG